ncbi:nuclear cap-binding subunit 1 [Raphidocelis subcapitata]|uniref:Nuclear cap-binding subunit 1 n=1 Tax=Raphidocelis subcapitata TaxID=307507 RepID=A0A2V0NSV3_9CHLO|nr:nuclear cap-binding subunit 1 [Raphidocelis subcapitata]|eukprot:GBF87915.1 nuclear cap-binding subunit 1 [Raphidocelis subcapitata]
MSHRGGEDRRPRWQDRRHDRGPSDRQRGPPGSAGQDRYHQGRTGHKRGREEGPPEDPKRAVIRSLLRLGEPQDSRDTPEGTIMPAVNALRRELGRKTPGLEELVIEAAVGASTKTTHLALVVGLLRLWEQKWVDALAAAAVEDCSRALAAGGPGRDRARLLVRWLACLVAPGVVSGASVARLLGELLDAARAGAEAGAGDGGGAAWQPWADHLAYCAVAALPWAGGDLADAAPDELGAVLEAAEAYMAARPAARDEGLSPWLPGILPEGDAVSGADSGGASFLGELWDAVRACQQEHSWQVASVPRGLASTFAQQLARGAEGDGAPPPFELPRLDPPRAPPAGAAASGTALRAAYPPRGGLVLLPRDKVECGRPSVERFVQEEYILDSIAAYDGRRVELASLLVSRLPLPYDGTGVLVETLLGAMARLPAPALRQVAYATLLMDVCKLARESPKYMAAWVRAAYDRAGALDPELRGRVAEYLAHHLSNFQWLWGWERWDAVLAQPPGHPQRAFCADVLRRMVGLSYWEHLKDGWAEAVDPETRATQRIKKFLPAEWEGMLGPKPEIAPLPGTEPAVQQQPQQQDADMQEAAAAKGEQQEAEEQQQQQRQQQQQEAEVEAITPETEWAVRLLSVLRSRKSQGLPHSVQDVRAWMHETGMQEQLGGPAAAATAAVRAVLAAGAKTPTHLAVMVERYGALLRGLADDADTAAGMQAGAAGGPGSAALLGAVAAGYARHPARLALAVDRLQSAGIVSPAAVVAWALQWEWLQLGPPRDPTRAGALLGMLRGALAAALSAEGAAHEEAERQGADVREAEAQLRAAAEEVERIRERDSLAAIADGADGAQRSSARLDFALRAEAAATARHGAARDVLEQLTAKVTAAGPALHEALLALYSGLASRLAAGSDGDGGEDGSGGAADGPRAQALAQARSFARWLALPSQAVAGELRALLQAGSAAEDARQALLGPLGLLD